MLKKGEAYMTDKEFEKFCKKLWRSTRTNTLTKQTVSR